MKQIRLPKKPDSVVNALRDAILSGEIESGVELTQVELAESLGVSRMPVREALIILEYQGLVERLPNQHMRVAEMDRAFFEDIFRLVSGMERKAAEAQGVNIQDFTDELDFHRTLCEKTENRFFQRIQETIAETYIQYGIRCSAYDKLAARSLLERFLSGEPAVLDEYYQRLTDAVMEARKR